MHLSTRLTAEQDKNKVWKTRKKTGRRENTVHAYLLAMKGVEVLEFHIPFTEYCTPNHGGLNLIYAILK